MTVIALILCVAADTASAVEFRFAKYRTGILQKLSAAHTAFGILHVFFAIG